MAQLLPEGTRVRFTQDWMNYPHAEVEKGETGTITYPCGTEIVCHGLPEIVAVKLDKHHAGLDEWENEFHFHSDYALKGMESILQVIEVI